MWWCGAHNMAEVDDDDLEWRFFSGSQVERVEWVGRKGTQEKMMILHIAYRLVLRFILFSLLLLYFLFSVKIVWYGMANDNGWKRLRWVSYKNISLSKLVAERKERKEGLK